ncbi:Uncharacterized protein DAT39_013354 [Clarias magur]|uniref:Uncharacterized protein n=1 Tax=Clarias magur TaxID=1594786 RepID=A0A8J4UG30_CLAMG|nr:Uncharacterized protein DAT39_013354 [Clarias magur]
MDRKHIQSEQLSTLTIEPDLTSCGELEPMLTPFSCNFLLSLFQGRQRSTPFPLLMG